MLEVLEDTILDSLKLIPFLFITYLIMELLEHKASKKTESIISKSGKFGPFIGSLLGIVPQCGFSAAAANFYAARIITKGTLIAIFLSTSDEMLPILISEEANPLLILEILAIKVVIAIAAGIIVDMLISKNNEEQSAIHKICENENCHCEEDGIIKSSFKHTLQIFTYIIIISLVINCIIYFVGEDKIANLIINNSILGVIIASAIGLIPNCASSVILTELYLNEIITLAPMIAGLLVNSGIGILVLFRVSKNKKDNFTILGILYLIGIISGILIEVMM